jgi:hypothetical protein
VAKMITCPGLTGGKGIFNYQALEFYGSPVVAAEKKRASQGRDRENPERPTSKHRRVALAREMRRILHRRRDER